MFPLYIIFVLFSPCSYSPPYKLKQISKDIYIQFLFESNRFPSAIVICKTNIFKTKTTHYHQRLEFTMLRIFLYVVVEVLIIPWSHCPFGETFYVSPSRFSPLPFRALETDL